MNAGFLGHYVDRSGNKVYSRDMTNTQITRYSTLLTTTYRSDEEQRELSLLMRLYQSVEPIYQREAA